MSGTVTALHLLSGRFNFHNEVAVACRNFTAVHTDSATHVMSYPIIESIPAEDLLRTGFVAAPEADVEPDSDSEPEPEPEIEVCSDSDTQICKADMDSSGRCADRLVWFCLTYPTLLPFHD